jgi:3-keto-5-aminohexanoate cleavage enzyme
MDKAFLTCALNCVLTAPRQHPMVPVTPAAMALSAREAFDAGASIMQIHFGRRPREWGTSQHGIRTWRRAARV